MADGRPNLQGIWQVRNRASYDLQDHVARHGMPAGRGVVDGGEIPYQPWAAAKKAENFANRATADPLSHCYLPGVPRIMYMEWPFQIFQTPTHVAMTFEWTQVHRLIYTNGSKPADGIEFWMGDSRGRWEGDTLVVEVTNHNDRTWFDMAGNFHSEALKVVERYTLLDRRHDAVRSDDRGSEGVHPAVEDQHADAPAQGHGCVCSSISARPRRKKPAAISSASRAPGIPSHDEPSVPRSARRVDSGRRRRGAGTRRRPGGTRAPSAGRQA